MAAIAALIAWAFLALNPMPAQATSAEAFTMTLQHIGEEDAALPRIVFTTGATGPAVARVVAIRVTQPTYQALCRVVVASGETVTPPTSRTGSFAVLATGCAGLAAASPRLSATPPPATSQAWPSLARNIEPETFLRLLDVLHARHKPGGKPPCPIPETLDRIANIIRQANHLN